jgi:ATP adenylyltransferase
MSEKFIWAPWRSEYILGPKEKGCIFCNRIKRNSDKKDLIVYRGKNIFVILNKFPYNSGHTMVTPRRHINSLDKLSEEESREFFDLIKLTVRVIRRALNPDSFNIGMNLGRGSGAGVPGHIHMHIVPRWREDTSFMPVIGETRVVSFDVGMIYRMLKKGFDTLTAESDPCPERKSRPKRS